MNLELSWLLQLDRIKSIQPIIGGKVYVPAYKGRADNIDNRYQSAESRRQWLKDVSKERRLNTYRMRHSEQIHSDLNRMCRSLVAVTHVDSDQPTCDNDSTVMDGGQNE